LSADLLGNPIALWASGALVVLQLFMTYLPTMQHLFGTASLDWAAWLAICTMGLGLFFIIELEKKLISRNHHRNHHNPA
jgi:P-type Ca2+ transporter type 2C